MQISGRNASSNIKELMVKFSFNKLKEAMLVASLIYTFFNILDDGVFWFYPMISPVAAYPIGNILPR